MTGSEAAGQRMRGQCLRGGVRFEVDVPERTYSVCRCGMCRRWSGGPLMSVHCPEPERLNDEGLTWYQGAPWAQRGFCSRCGASLFWRWSWSRRACWSSVSTHWRKPMASTSTAASAATPGPPATSSRTFRPRVTEAELLKELGLGT